MISDLLPHMKSRAGLYAAAWTFAGVAALGYLGVAMIARPPSRADRLDLGEQRDARLEETLGRLSQDVHEVKVRQAATEEQSAVVLGRVVSLEERTAAWSHGAMQSAAAATAGGTPASVITTASIQRTAAPAAPPTSLTPPAVKAAQAREAAQQQVRQQGHAILIASGPNTDALRLSWQLLNEKHGQLLGPLQTRYRPASQKPNAPVQLLAGPLASPAEAGRLCKELAAAGATCRATNFAGEAL